MPRITRRYYFKSELFFVCEDICNASIVGDLLRQHRPDAIFHLAAESHVDRSIDAPDAFVQTNVVGTFTLLKEAYRYWLSTEEKKDTFRFLHISTDEVFGSLGEDGFFSETTAYSPRSPYSATKAASDHLVSSYFHTYGFPALITNASNNYGPYQFPEKLIPLMFSSAIAGNSLPVYGDGGNVRDWLYVMDHCRALFAVYEKGTPGEHYNIGGNCEKANLEVVGAICDILDELYPRSDKRSYREQITFVRDRLGHDRRYAVSTDKIKRSIGWEPEESFLSGLRQTVRWYLDNNIWLSRIFEKKYNLERLGLH